MKSTTSTIRRRGVVAAVLLSGLLLVATACGGGSKSESSSTTAAGGSSATTASGGSSGGSSGTVDVSNCSSFFKKVNDMQAQLEKYVSSASSSGTVDWDGFLKAIDSITSSVPSEIKSDWNTVLAATKKMINVFKGVNLATATPEQMAQLDTAMKEVDTPEVQKASDNLDAYAKKHCPQMADTPTTSSN